MWLGLIVDFAMIYPFNNSIHVQSIVGIRKSQGREAASGGVEDGVRGPGVMKCSRDFALRKAGWFLRIVRRDQTEYN